MRSPRNKIPRPSEAKVVEGRGDREVGFLVWEDVVGRLERTNVWLTEAIGDLREMVGRMKKL